MVHSCRLQRTIRFILVSLGAIITMYPLLWMLSSSFKPEYYIFKDLNLWPVHFTLDNYVQGWKGIAGISFQTFFKNSLTLVFFVIVANLITCSMAAYAFARLEFPLRKIFFAIMFTTIMLPPHATLIPRYIIFNRLGWINTILPLVVPHLFAIDTFFIFLMVQFIRGLPRELDQAATVDGCGPIQIYLRIILPLALPALVTTTIFSFIWTWNDFFSQLIYISNPKLFTVTLGLRAFLDATAQSAYGAMFAMSILSLAPIFILFIFFQRLLIEGVSTSGLKG